MTGQQLEAIARVALANDVDPVRWEDAPDWRRAAMAEVARAAIGASGLSRADHAFSAWLLSMTVSGWKWGRDLDERERTHPGIIMFGGGLPREDTTRWTRLVDAVRARAREVGLWVTE
jgi:hypothetical protein